MKKTLRATKYLALPRKSKFGFLMSSMSGPLDAQGLDLALAQDPLEEELAHEVRREDVRHETPHEGDREALDGPGAELEEEGGGDERGGVGVEDRDPDALEAVLDRDPHRLAVAELLADALEHEHVGVDAHADGED